MTPFDPRSRLLALIELRAKITREIDYLEASLAQIRHRRPVAVCGTDSGYLRHLRPRKGEKRTEPCTPCRRAHAQEERRRIERRNAERTALRSAG